MKLILLIILILSSFSSFAKINLVFDIDYTITHEVPKGTPNSFKLGDGKYYRVNDWVLEGIDNMRAYNVDIFFFSGGKQVRNVELLKKLKLPSTGESLHSIAKGIYSFKDLEQVASEGKFGERNKKNLAKLGFDLDKTLLIDDYENFVPKGQKKNMLWLGSAYHHFESLEEGISYIGKGVYETRYIPQSYDQWLIAKNKFKFINELVLDALEKTSESNFLSYIQKNKAKYIPYGEVLTSKFEKIFKRGGAKPNLCFRNQSLFQYQF